MKISYEKMPHSTFRQTLRKKLDTVGYVVLKNYILKNEPIEQLKDRFEKLCLSIGETVGHDREGAIIWDIKSDPPNSKQVNGVITYSQHNHEADLHTDSQYSVYPEDYFGLLTLRKAACGGGISYLLSLADILTELKRTAEGRRVRKVLENTSFPFIVPAVFKQEQSDQPEFNFGPILQKNEIRFRVDTIKKALEYDAGICTQEQVAAFKFMVNLVRTTPYRKEFFLENGDLILINNKTMLHGRGSFTDYNRHLLRIRMNKPMCERLIP